ncbi:MAG: acyltransferase [Parcubacteria group bacterium]|nr:acyltransferase [Parcubacteria group bacterium]
MGKGSISLGRNVVVASHVELSHVVVGDETRIGPFTFIFGSEDHPVQIGKNCQFTAHCYINGSSGLEIGDNVGFAPGAMIFSDSGPLPSKKLQRFFPITEGKIVIHDDVWICAQAMILPGVTIGSMSVIASGSLVTKDVPSGVVVGGIPAKIIKTLDLEE